MARKPASRLASSAGGGRSRERRVPAIRSASLRADALGGRSFMEALFVPDLLLPEQWVAGVRRDSVVSGTKALLLAVLKDGIRCFGEQRQGPHPNPRVLAEEAEVWITAVADDQPCSFENICEVLGFDPSRLRACLLAGKATRRHGTETREHPALSGPTIHPLRVRSLQALAPAPRTAVGSAARRCPGWNPEATSRRAEPSADMPRQAG